jgi:hypothetical protein|tara:strand:- start:336 stop:857 length:522 start_codon:yes stop_codon:yes gene_type:complete
MNQWFIFGLNGAGKSWFLKNKKCEDITKYKWNSEDTFSALDKSWESGDKTCAYAFHTLKKFGTVDIHKCNLIHYPIQINGINENVWESWIHKEREKEAIILITSRQNILQRLKKRGFNQLDQYIESTPLMMVGSYKTLIRLLKEQNISYIILNSSNEQYNIVDESEIETIIEL